MDHYLNRLKRLAHIDPKNPELHGRLGRAEEQAGSTLEGQTLAEWVQRIGVWDNETREAALEIVLQSGGAAAPYLHELVHNSEDFWTRYRALEALKSIRALTVGTLIRALSDTSSSMRYLAAKYLRSFGRDERREILPALFESMGDEKWYVRREAALALRDLWAWLKGDPQTEIREVEELSNRIRGFLSDEDARVRGALGFVDV